MPSLHLLDMSGTLLGFLATLLYVKASKWSWPMGMLATLNDGVLCAISGIYGDMLLQVVYFFSMFYGWYLWTRGGDNQKALPISRASRLLVLRLIALVCLGTLLASQCLIHYTNSQIPYLDATTMVLSLVAQWLTCKKLMESWILWFLVDGIYIGLYSYKGIPFHAGLSLLYLGMAAAGYWNWSRLMAQQKQCQHDADLTA